MASTPQLQDRPRVLVVGGGYVGLYVALKLQKKIANAGGIVTVVDPLPYMTYQPFLPEVAGGNIEARHAVVSHRQHLKQTELIQGRVTSIDHANRTAVVAPSDGGENFEIPYFDVVLAAGAITRTFPIKGLADKGIGLKTIEEAVALRNGVLERIETGSLMTDPVERARALTFVVVGGGFAGIECITGNGRPGPGRGQEQPARQAGGSPLRPGRGHGPDHARGHGQAGRMGCRAPAQPRHRGAAQHLAGQRRGLAEAHQPPGQDARAGIRIGHPRLDCRRAGQPDGPLTDFPLEPRGRVRVLPDLRVSGDEGIIENAWAAGDIAAVPDLTGSGCPTAPASRTPSTRCARPSASPRTCGPPGGRRNSRTTSTRTWAPSPASANGRVLPISTSSAGSVSRDRSPGWRTAATTAWPCRPWSARSA